MGLINRGWCGHPGVHAEVIPEGTEPQRCPTQCKVCQDEIAAEAAAAVE